MDAHSPLSFQIRSRVELRQLLMLLLVVLLMPLALPSGPAPESGQPVPFDLDRYRKIARRNPDVMLIGNSMLNTRVDKSLFDRLADPNRVAYLGEGGTRSTAWYFMLKNFAAPLEPPPKVVFLFYRDYDFTAPWLHLEGTRLDTARTFMKPEDEELLNYARKLGGIAPRSVLADYLPEQMTLDVRRRLGNLAVDIGAAGRGRTGDTELQNHLNDLFDFQNLREDVLDEGALLNDIVPGATKQFTVDPAQNLLELFHTLAESRGIKLVFYRVKRRPDERNLVTQDPELVAYTREFAHWASAHGHSLIDETDDPRLTLAMYHDGDHLGRAAMPEYTRIFLERVRAVLPAPPVGSQPQLTPAAPVPEVPDPGR